MMSSRTTRLRFAAGAFATFAFAALVMSLFLPSPEVEQGEILLEPARRHSPSPLDAVARLSKGALDAAAGSAEDLGFTRDTVLTPSDVELTFVRLVNADRAANGLDPVEYDPSLLGIARIRAAAQRGGPLSHLDAVGQLAFVSLFSDWQVPYTLAGENLARHSRNSVTVAADLERALMNSPTHRANILEPAFREIAVGEAPEGGGIAFAQIFRAPGN